MKKKIHAGDEPTVVVRESPEKYFDRLTRLPSNAPQLVVAMA